MAIQLVDAEHLTLVQANQAASAYMALETGCAIGCTPEQVYDPERARMLRADMQAAIDGGEAIHREYLLQSKSGSQVWDVNYLPLHHEDEAADQLLVVASDITEQRAAEKARLDAAIAQREMLVREVHHRIKNNLQGVAGLLQQIAARKPEVAPAISEVVGQVQAIAHGLRGCRSVPVGPLRAAQRGRGDCPVGAAYLWPDHHVAGPGPPCARLATSRGRVHPDRTEPQ